MEDIEENIPCFSCEMYNAARCRFCSSTTFCGECLKRYQKWHIQPLLSTPQPQEKLIPELGHAVSSVQTTSIQVNQFCEKLIAESRNVNNEWERWTLNWQSFETLFKQLVEKYAKINLQLINTELSKKRLDLNNENKAEWLRKKSDVKKRWFSEKEEEWKKREVKLKQEFLKNQEKIRVEKWNKWNRIGLDDTTKRIIQDLLKGNEAATLQNEQLEWLKEWNEEMRQKWKEAKNVLLKDHENNIVEWDLKKEMNDKKYQVRQEINHIQEDFQEVAKRTQPAQINSVSQLVTQVNQTVKKLMQEMQEISPSSYNALTQMTTKMEDTLEKCKEDFKDMNQRRFEEEREKLINAYDQHLQFLMGNARIEMEQEFQQKLEVYKVEFKKEFSQQCYTKLYEITSEQKKEFHALAIVLLRKIYDHKVTIKKLHDTIKRAEEEFAAVVQNFQDACEMKDKSIEKLQEDMSKLVIEHGVELETKEEELRKEFAITSNKIQLSLENKLAYEYRTKETEHLQLIDVLQKRRKEKTKQLNQLLAQVGKQSFVEERQLAKAQLDLEKHLSSANEIRKQQSKLQDERIQLPVDEETQEKKDQLQKTYDDLQRQLNHHLAAIQNLDYIISSLKESHDQHYVEH